MRKFLFFFLMTTACWAQSINEYKYVIVASKFDAQKSPGQYGLNNLTKLFLQKNGFTVFYDTDILPAEVSNESCNKLYANVFDDNTFRKTKLRVEIKDCRNAVLFVSEYGESTEKDNHIAFNQALRAAFKSFDKPQFRFNPELIPSTRITDEPLVNEKSATSSASVAEGSDDQAELSAQKIQNGYQLVDRTPKIVWRIWNTSLPDVYIAQGDGVNGVLFKSDGKWTLEYYTGGAKVVEHPNIKF